MRGWITPSSRHHEVPAGFPEGHHRVAWAEEACRIAELPLEPPPDGAFTGEELRSAVAAVHRDDRLARVREAAVPYRGNIDSPECPVSPGTPVAVEDALRTTLHALQEVHGAGDSGFALVRPPGHHASERFTIGFCYVNHIAAAAREAQRLGRSRVFILDIDVHHGNGTQDIFYEDSEVFFCSLHEDPRMQFPGTGYADETGAGAGLGATRNLPFVTRSDPEAFVRALEEHALEAMERHRPDIVLVSAGFDTHIDDPLGGLLLEEPHYRRLGAGIGAALAHLRVPGLAVLEGGYVRRCFTEGLAPFLQGWRSSETGSDAAPSRPQSG